MSKIEQLIIALTLLISTSVMAQSCAETSYPVWFKKFAGNPDGIINRLEDFDLAYNGDLLTCGSLMEPSTASMFLGFIRYTNFGGATDKWFVRYLMNASSNLALFTVVDSLEIQGCKFMQKQSWGGIEFAPTRVMAYVHNIGTGYREGGILHINAATGNVLQYTKVTKALSSNKFEIAFTSENIGGYMSSYDDIYLKPYFAVMDFTNSNMIEVIPRKAG